MDHILLHFFVHLVLLEHLFDVLLDIFIHREILFTHRQLVKLYIL